MNDLPDPDTLFTAGQHYDGDWTSTPDGTRYRRFLIIRYQGAAYVLENHLNYANDKYYTTSIVKRLV